METENISEILNKFCAWYKENKISKKTEEIDDDLFWEIVRQVREKYEIQ